MSRVARPAAPRTALSPERIAEAALQLIDDEGLDGFSMRSLGARLGVEAMAIYHHYPSKGHVLDAVMDHLLADWRWPPSGSATALERLRRAMHGYRGIALAHPHAFPLLVGRRFNSPGVFAVYERLLQLFAELGLDAAATARWFRTLGYFVSGAGMADIASREIEPDATSLRLQHAPQSVTLPHVAAVAPHLRVDQLDAVFDFGLETLLSALERQARPPRSARPRVGR
ncbi:TetR/AcrR family transcriptional regulator [Ideonella sp.]|uniref:TetR/AcrR family transcriptional regulator n=1 Tax=Ideonella sp. TaxID=1929293 RepID=UPI002B484528|nr:TetR/AcrR family transcriptional regulator [Ideonella sp.]HJV68006.1 TetR/AcrR family transcriptional regulator [Ideonella sp.]